MVLVLMSPDRQEASLCRFFLRMAMQRARGLLGAADDDRLGKLARWLDDGFDRGEPPPFAAGAPADNGTAERIALLHDCSRELALPFVLLMGGLALLSLNGREFRSEEHTSELQ